MLPALWLRAAIRATLGKEMPSLIKKRKIYPAAANVVVAWGSCAD